MIFRFSWLSKIGQFYAGKRFGAWMGGKEGWGEEGALTVPDLSPMRIRPFLTFRPWVKGQERSDKRSRSQPSPGPSRPLGPCSRGCEVSL